MKKEAIRVSAMIPAAPTTLYYAWLSSEQHGAMTDGTTAKIDPTVGAKFSALNGAVSGKLVILDLGRRIVMAWRSSEFPRDAHDSRVEMHLEALGGSTRITLIQTEIPEGLGEKTRSIWNDQYFGPMRNFFSKFLPDPRNPPPPRRPPPPPEDDEEEEVEEKPKKGAKAVAAKAVAAKAAPAAKGKAAPPPPAKKPAAPPPPPPKAEKKAAKPEPPAKKPAKPAKAAPAPKKAAKPEKPAKKAAKPEKAAKKADKKPAKKADKKPAKKADKKPAKKKK